MADATQWKQRVNRHLRRQGLAARVSAVSLGEQGDKVSLGLNPWPEPEDVAALREAFPAVEFDDWNTG